MFEKVVSSPGEPQGTILTSFLFILRISKQVSLFNIRRSQNTLQRSSLRKNKNKKEVEGEFWAQGGNSFQFVRDAKVNSCWI